MKPKNFPDRVKKRRQFAKAALDERLAKYGENEWYVGRSYSALHEQAVLAARLS